MRLSIANTAIYRPIAAGAPAFLCAISLGLASLPATADLQTGRSPQGTLWISDQGLPSNVKPLAPEGINVPTLSTSAAANTATNTPATPDAGSTGVTPSTDSSPMQNKASIRQKPESAQDKTTCNGIEQRYERSRADLARIEQDKVSGKVLIPESGLVTMRQNLATLERLKALCR